jgi:hypothetical protein
MEDQEYKGIDGYYKELLGLSEADLRRIRENLINKPAAPVGRL